jgi:hypothetical protein
VRKSCPSPRRRASRNTLPSFPAKSVAARLMARAAAQGRGSGTRALSERRAPGPARQGQARRGVSAGGWMARGPKSWASY